MLFLLIFTACFSAALFGVLAFVLWLSGYGLLAERYAVYNSSEWQMQSAHLKLGRALFQNNIKFALTEDGIFMALKLPYTLLIPHALFIPWVDIKVTEISEHDRIPQITMQLGPHNLPLVLYDEIYFHKLWQLTSYLATLERTDFSDASKALV